MISLECAVCTLSAADIPAGRDPQSFFVTTGRWGTVCRACADIAEEYLDESA